jgi:hypothetical protein
VALGGFLRQRGVLCSDAAQPELVAELNHAPMLETHPITSVITSSHTLREC